MEKGLLEMYAFKKAEKYLSDNPERLTKAEIEKFYVDLRSWLYGETKVINDEIYDFLIAQNLYRGEGRVDTFANYLIDKYPVKDFKKVVDVGAGRMCRLSAFLAQKGYNVDAIDTNIRLTNTEAKELGISRISKYKFLCDEYSNKGRGTKIDNKDLIVGLEPCDATEHIIRQGLKYDKPFEVMLCYSPHNALNGEKFKTVEEWYRHLKDISEEVHIQAVKSCSFVATNNPDKTKREMCF